MLAHVANCSEEELEALREREQSFLYRDDKVRGDQAAADWEESHAKNDVSVSKLNERAASLMIKESVKPRRGLEEPGKQVVLVAQQQPLKERSRRHRRIQHSLGK